ncbi:F0F1 ATP synthase subunit gamma [Candidatus Sumerlaeota bacterium]|nr:F0F1 ATP synthase subunit gamma [Candidatus Sumerlaeota bacterium]
MLTIFSLGKKIKSVQDLQSVVKTMKILAAVSIRQYERAVASLSEYARTLEMGFQILLQSAPMERFLPQRTNTKRYGIIIFGSEQGMCGQFNEQIAAFAEKDMRERGISPENRVILSIGTRLESRLNSSGISAEHIMSLPSSVFGITAKALEVILKIESWQSGGIADFFIIYFNEYLSGSTFRQKALQILPLNPDWMRDLETKKWESRSLPAFTMDRTQLTLSLIRQYLFTSLYRCFAESLASENASRMLSMQAAEKNIDDKLNDLLSVYHQKRQTTITEELLDIVSGFEALTE